ncbi:Reverse transcriptase zinc-binding domain [Sesbania bispinosa]|nr:Reverse transcriptase zinc-binding domain [Sesbania bispinosa]
MDHIVKPVPNVLVNLVVAYMSDGCGNWHFHKFQEFLPDWLILKIQAIMGALHNQGEDKVIWGLTSDGNFSTKTAYAAVCRNPNHIASSLWKKLWRWPRPQRTRNFIWLVLHDGLKTNSYRKRRGFTDSDLCPLCKTTAETTIHILQDCSFSNAFGIL